MQTIVKPLAVVAAGAVLTTSAFAQSAKTIRGASPYVAIKNEPAAKLIVDPPLAEGLAHGLFWAQWRTCTSHPCSGPAVVNRSGNTEPASEAALAKNGPSAGPPNS